MPSAEDSIIGSKVLSLIFTLSDFNESIKNCNSSKPRYVLENLK
jgi:hypothetical protein